MSKFERMSSNSGNKPPTTRYFAAWEVDRTPSNCVPSALPTDGDADNAAGNNAEDGEDAGRSGRGYGCPNDYPCDIHCASKPQYTGGYCTGFLWQVCKCY